MTNWYVDEGLQTLIAQWKKKYPHAVVGTIGDQSHQAHNSEHNPEKQGSAPGADKGEVDGADFMEGHGVSKEDLDDLFEALWHGRDGRVLYLIWEQHIVSSVVSPWKLRPYKGEYHGHVHVSVNDKYDANRQSWEIGRTAAMPPTYHKLEANVPVLKYGDEDQPNAYAHIKRAQIMLVHQFGLKLSIDGVYGAYTAAGIASVMKGKNPTVNNGKVFDVREYRVIFGL